MKETFFLPDIPPLLHTSAEQSEKIVIVSIIGKSSYSSLGHKVRPLEKLFPNKINLKKQCTIEGAYDDENQIVYLHLHSLLDTSILIENYATLASGGDGEQQNADFLSVYDQIKDSFARATLLLFHISHIVILSHPGSSFDTSYVQLFKALDQIRHNSINYISTILRDIPNLNPQWISNGRPCTPRLVFYFERCPKQFRQPQKYPHLSIKKLEHEIEDRIYHILRKVRIVGSTNCNSLFAIPANQEYVYIDDSTDPTQDRLSTAVNNLIKSCQPGGMPELTEFPFCSQPERYSKGRSFHKFLQVHTDQAFNKGFDDNVGSGRHSAHAPAYFEVPPADQWIKVTAALYEYFMVLPKDEESSDHLSAEKLTALNTDTRFSEQRCLKVKPLAISRYLENLPTHYTTASHEARLAMALSVFSMQARGPMFDKYSEQVIDKCTKIFESGKQLCEHPSLTRNPCTNPKVKCDQDHCSGVRYIAACDCGRKQGPREDPYVVRQANHTFYQTLAAECVCNTLERVKFPVFQPSTQEYRAAKLFSNAPPIQKHPPPVKSQELEHSQHMSELSQDSGLLGASKSGYSLAQEQQNLSNSEIILELLDDGDSSKDKNLVRQPSTTEYLPGMLTTTSPQGLLPQYSSWSLVCLGPSSLYSHNLGLSENQHPGFLAGTNFLLPWDVTVRFEHSKPNWPSLDSRKYQANLIRSRRTRAGSGGSQFVVKIFVGVEYECPRGHRFMLSSPDKVLRASSGIVKDTGHKITNSDMPLYFNCPCRPNKPLVAQLMRVHVVTPKAPVYVTLNPKVQPTTWAPIFVPTLDGPVRISQSAYWVLRLPYIYATDKPFLASRQTAEEGPRLLQGMWGVAEAE